MRTAGPLARLALFGVGAVLLLGLVESSLRVPLAVAIAVVVGGRALMFVQEALTRSGQPEARHTRLDRLLAHLRRRRAGTGRTSELSVLQHSVERALRRESDARLFLLPSLRDLADERLRVEHGVNARREPDAARRLLGDSAWTLLYGGERWDAVPERARLEPARLADTLDALERLS